MRTNVAIVTGASSGIGLQIAQTLLTHDDRVVVVSRTASRRRPLADKSRFLAVDGDVDDESTATRAVDAARTPFGTGDHATLVATIEYAAEGLRMNTIAAGIIDTPMHPKGNQRGASK